MLKKLLQSSKRNLSRHSSTILTCIGVVGVVATAVLAVKATPKALKLMGEQQHRKITDSESEYPEPLTPVEVVRTTWKCYIPAALIGISTIACIFGANILNKRNQASLASAYAILHQSYQKYRNAAKTVYGEDADSKIKAQMAKDAYVSADGYSIYSLDDDAESERILCYDHYSSRYFTTTMAAILNAEYHLNRNLNLRGAVSINEFYEFLGIEKIEEGDKIGWCMDKLMDYGVMWLDFENYRTKMDDGMECCIISALWEPNLSDADFDI